MVISCKTCKSLAFNANVSYVPIMHVKNVTQGRVTVRRRCEIQRSDCSFDYAVLRTLIRQRQANEISGFLRHSCLRDVSSTHMALNRYSHSQQREAQWSVLQVIGWLAGVRDVTINEMHRSLELGLGKLNDAGGV